MNSSNDLRQRLLEWQYGLLSDSEAAELERLVETDPTVAAQAEETRRMAELFSRAAQPQFSPEGPILCYVVAEHAPS